MVAEPVFTPHNFFSEDYYGTPYGQFDYDRDPIYDPNLDYLHQPDTPSTETESSSCEPGDSHCHSTSESDGNFVPIAIPGAFAPGDGYGYEDDYYYEDDVYGYDDGYCDCAAIEAERDALYAELLLYKIKYEGYQPADYEPGYDRHSAYYDADPVYELPIYNAGPSYSSADPARTIYTPDEYAYAPLDEYYDNPLEDSYYSDPTAYYAGVGSSVFSGNPIEYFDNVVNQDLGPDYIPPSSIGVNIRDRPVVIDDSHHFNDHGHSHGPGGHTH